MIRILGRARELEAGGRDAYNNIQSTQKKPINKKIFSM